MNGKEWSVAGNATHSGEEAFQCLQKPGCEPDSEGADGQRCFPSTFTRTQTHPVHGFSGLAFIFLTLREMTVGVTLGPGRLPWHKPTHRSAPAPDARQC